MQSSSKKRRSCGGDEAVKTGSPFLPPPDVVGYLRLHRYDWGSETPTNAVVLTTNRSDGTDTNVHS